MRRALLVLLVVSCDGEDSLGNLSGAIDGKPAEATSCVLSTAASIHRPNGLYVLAELPGGQLEIDVDESGAVDAQRVIWLEQNFRSQAVQGQVTLLGPPKERRGEFDLTFTAGSDTRHLTGRFWPKNTTPPAADPNAQPDDSSSGVDTGCDASNQSDEDSSGCDGSSSSADTSSGCDSGGGGGEGCSGDPGGGSCSSSAHAARVAPHIGTRRPVAARIVLWALPYALVGVVIQLWRRRLRCRR